MRMQDVILPRSKIKDQGVLMRLKADRITRNKFCASVEYRICATFDRAWDSGFEDSPFTSWQIQLEHMVQGFLEVDNFYNFEASI